MNNPRFRANFTQSSTSNSVFEASEKVQRLSEVNSSVEVRWKQGLLELRVHGLKLRAEVYVNLSTFHHEKR